MQLNKKKDNQYFNRWQLTQIIVQSFNKKYYIG